MIDRHAFKAESPCDDAATNIMFAREALEAALKSRVPPRLAENYNLVTRQDWLMFFLQRVARYYGVDKGAVLESWVSHNLPTLLEGGV